LKENLEKSKNARRRLIVTDGVFSMDGDLAPLPEIADLAEKYNAMIMVDDAHGEGVLGDHGRGIVDHFGLHGRIDVEMGTMSKAFGVIGGYVAGSKVLVDYLRQKARTFLLATAPTMIDVAACIAAIKLVEGSDQLVKKLWDNTRFFAAGMKSLGFDLGHSETPIIPVILGDEKLAQKFEETLLEQKLLAHAIVFPTVARGKARLRVQISAAHTQEDLGFALSTFEKTGRENNLLPRLCS
jgi:glycine C-acetyltransferase